MLSQFHRELLKIPLNCKTVVAVALLAACSVIASLALAQSIETDTIDADCQCRAPDGQMRDLGSIECVNIVGRRKLVRCEMSTNTPYWKNIDGIEGCPSA